MLPVKNNLLPTVSRFFDDDWNSLFDWTSGHPLHHKSTVPAVNIRNLPDEFVVEVAAPGLKKEDFQIELKNNQLSVKAELQKNREVEDYYTRKEFSYHSFQRSFDLNSRLVDDAKIKGIYNDGILRIHLPKKEEAKVKPARLIKIS